MTRECHVRFCESAGVRSPRATHLVILCRSEAEAQNALHAVQEWVAVNGLTLHPDKTRLSDCREPGRGFEFLGYRFEAGKRLSARKA